MSKRLLIASVLVGICAGILIGELLIGMIAFRRVLGHLTRRGELAALVAGHCIYDSDIDLAWRADLYSAGAVPDEIETATAARQKREIMERLIKTEVIATHSRRESVAARRIDEEANVLRAEFGDAKLFNKALEQAHTTSRALQHAVAGNIREREWIEGRVSSQLPPSEEECHRYFNMHQEAFREPLRLRANHLFVAAPIGCPVEVGNAKQSLIRSLSKRIHHGESFSSLVAQFSEDEASKRDGGDLNYFSARRMLPAFFAAAENMSIGEISAPIQTPLGFHLIQLTASVPPRQMSFDEARPEIMTLLKNKRRLAVDELTERLGQGTNVARLQ
ncbi:MAG: peptidylprolyl isomerase [Verrucomicrobiota bacterium]